MGSQCAKAPIQDSNSMSEKNSTNSTNSPTDKFDTLREMQAKKRVIGDTPSLGVSSGVMSQGPGRNCMLQGNVDVECLPVGGEQQNTRCLSRSGVHNNGTLFGIFDGFGEKGKLFSKAAMDISGLIFERIQEEKRKQSSNGETSTQVNEGPQPPEIPEKRRLSIGQEFILQRCLEEAHTELVKKADETGAANNGASAILALHEGDGQMYFASIGNCLAVYGQYVKTTASGKEEHKCVVVNKPHIPSDPDEKERIEASGGEVRHWKIDVVGELGQVAVWYGKDHPKSGAHAPGVLVSRCVGFESATEVGILHKADHNFLHVNPRDFVILGSHGLWQIVDQDEAVKFVSECGGTAQEASDGLVMEGIKRWQDRWSGEDVSCQVFYPGLVVPDHKKTVCKITNSRITSSKAQKGNWY